MSKHKWLLSTGILLAASGMILVACTKQDSKSTESTKTTLSSLSTGEVSTTLSKVDNSKWLYNADDQVYYQIGISYAATPTDAEQQTLSIFVPAAYMTATDNGDGTYTATLNTSAKVGNYTAETAPVVVPINTPGYSAMAALTEYSSQAATYTKEGFIYVSAGLRGRDSGAPGGVTDAKAAIRYIRYNAGTIAGDTDNVFVFGMSGGGAQSAILGVSGDSADYDDYLKEIGAVEGVSDAVQGVMAWCPVTSLDTANEAYEWNLGSSRTDLDEATQTLSDALANSYATYINKLGLKDEDGNKLILKKSETGIYQAGSYYDYIKETVENSLNTFLENTTFPYDASASSSASGHGFPGGGQMPEGFTPPADGQMPEGFTPPTGQGAPSGAPSGQAPTGSSGTTASTSIEDVDNIQRTTTSNSSLDLSGTYNSVEEYIAALNATSQWVTYDATTKKVTITSVADFVKYLKSASKSVGAFDALDASQGENELFGTGDGGVHWDSTMAKLLEGTEYEEAYTTDLKTTDSLGKDLTTRINMYSPLYYLSDYYEGVGTSTVAKNWRIRTGINQGDTALSTEVNLALALENYGIDNVDFATVWGKAHTEAEVTGDSTTNFIAWVNETMADQSDK